ncbi:hypothetical protein GCM10027277_47580 [Pseudoduganella ginsengisoli]|uniref:Uncharacterized protein n=1 Tax=Pseudoduganella ginsengisoli TaxID=1462440 RepID=A0A6L6Q2F1_9BURK|nr:hypothetical protein [Pseudoduganella ginsengisoli]MTW04053.1 hypothetical protein [Pseudoduganella ginsengisoli]
MMKCLAGGWLLAAAAAVAGPVSPSDPAAIEAYRRLPYCRLAPDGKRLAEEPCRRPPTRSFAERRTAPLMPLQPMRPHAAPHAAPHPAPRDEQLPAATLAAPALPVAPAITLPPVPPAPPAVLPPVQPLNQCDTAGCRGANGTLFQQGAGNIVLDPSGRMCTRQGQWVHCQ